jgi:hypothetical protein
VMQFTWVHQRGGNSAEFEWLGVYQRNLVFLPARACKALRVYI